MTPQAYIFIGRSGSGKGTQAGLLIDLLKKKDPDHGVLYLQSGQELRGFVEGDGYVSKLTKQVLSEGGLVPEFMPIYLWVHVLNERYHGNEHLVFDGTPRKPMEAKILDGLFPFFNLAKPWIIFLNTESDESKKRLISRKRYDDDEKAIIKRFSWYETEVAPTVDYYRTNPSVNFLEIDGNRTIEDIHADIVNKLGLV